MSVTPPQPRRWKIRHVWAAGGVVGLLVVSAFWRVHSMWSLLSLLGQLALVAGATWVFAERAKRYRRQEDAAFAVVRELKLERDGTGEEGNGGYPCDSVWQCYRGLFDGARIKWLKVWVGSAQRGGTLWIAVTEIFPPFKEEFRLDASYAPKPMAAPHPRLPANRELWWQPQPWLATWLDSLPEAAATALRTFLGADHRCVVTNREVFCFVNELSRDGAPAAHAVFREMVALARLLAASAERANPFNIHTSFHYVRYQEGENSFELAVDPGEKSSWVYVPTAENWPTQVPAWAAGRREVIVARLRAHLDPSFEFVDG